MRMLDLFCGRGGWTNAFLNRGWKVTGVDIVRHPDYRGEFIQVDILDVSVINADEFDFVCSSSPCEQFSVHGMAHFHVNPPYPEMGLKLFKHAQHLCEESGLPYVMENVRSAQAFVGKAEQHCGPFYLWGNAVPPLLPQGIRKSMVMGNSSLVNELKRTGNREALKAYRRKFDMMWSSSKSPARKEATAKAATIPPELANCVADYAERILTDHLQTDVRQVPIPSKASSGDEL